MSKSVELFHKLFIILLLALAVSQFAFAESEKNELFEGLNKTAYNFRSVTPNLYRSGLISKESIPYLKELGIKTVVTFDNRLERVEKEQKFLEEAGIKSISIPWSGWDRPNDETIQRIHNIMDAPEMQPVLVHCKHGQERTGVVIASWRISHQNWSFDQAYEEMKVCGFRWFQYGHLKNYVYDFSKRHGDQKAHINIFERVKTKVFSFFYSLRKIKPF